ncbi:hypothetical protein GNI_190080, partial [Gregarina niphandrodes]
MSIEDSEGAKTASAAGYEGRRPVVNKTRPNNNAVEAENARKRGVAHIQPLTTTEIGIALLDLRNEVAALRKEQKDERTTRQQQMDRNEAMFKDLVDAYIGMTTTVKELKTEVTDRLNKNIGEIKDKLNTIATKYDMNAQMRST